MGYKKNKKKVQFCAGVSCGSGWTSDCYSSSYWEERALWMLRRWRTGCQSRCYFLWGSGPMLHRSDDRQLLLTEGQHEIFKVLRWHFFFFFSSSQPFEWEAARQGFVLLRQTGWRLISRAAVFWWCDWCEWDLMGTKHLVIKMNNC